MAGRLERLKLKTKVDTVLAKGSTSETGKWNKHDLKVMIQWFKHDDDKAMPKNKEGLLLHYRETHTRVVKENRGAYPHEDMVAAVAAPVDDASNFAFDSTNQPNNKACAVAAAGSQAAAYVPPPTHVAPKVADTTTSIIPTSTAAVASNSTAAVKIVVDSAPTVPTSDCQQNTAPSNSHSLDWGEVNPFDVGVHLNMEDPALPLCFASEDESCSDDDSVFVNLLRY
jgi:hypothetical protein